MAEFVVNVTLIVALFVLLVAWTVSASRRRRRDRREHAQKRRLILGAFTAAAEELPVKHEDVGDTRGEFAERSARSSQPPRKKTALGQSSTIPAQHLDPASIVALLDLLEDAHSDADSVAGIADLGVVTDVTAVPGGRDNAGRVCTCRATGRTRVRGRVTVESCAVPLTFPGGRRADGKAGVTLQLGG